ncbi:MAG: permease, partial [Pseudomonadota bacterium]|nr:permease [Pseudomonadota bacterium]
MRALAAPSALLRFSRHELRLAWRDWAWMFSGWRSTSLRRALIGMSLFYAVMHLIAYAVLSPRFATGFVLDQTAQAALSV